MSNPVTEDFISYIAGIRRYSPRTRSIYRNALDRFFAWAGEDSASCLDNRTLRAYEVYMMDELKESARTVNLHLSILSSLCRHLMKEGVLQSNPVRLVPRPKSGRRLPQFYREESMLEYFKGTDYYVSEEFVDILSQTADKDSYCKILKRLVVSLLYNTGIRRSELISLNRSSLDRQRRVLKVHGKGDKDREIPIVPSLFEELSLYLIAVSSFISCTPSPDTPLLLTPKGGRLYPVYVDRIIKEELGGISGITGRKSPHVLRHTIASELLGGGTDLNSIKEFLGHSSLAATQVYTHSTIERLQSVYNNAHPRAKNGGNNGD